MEPALWTLKTYFFCVGYISCRKPCSSMVLHGFLRARLPGGKGGDSYVLKLPYPLEQDPYQLHDEV